jgi:L-alanine-DL-glutamate epimerase-like enolase superfamily enzyme
VSGARLRWRPFRLTLRAAFRSALPGAAGELRTREGLLLAIEDGAGAIGWGEAAPLPLPGAPTVGELAALLEADAAALLAAPPRAPAALRCGLEAALLDLEGRRRALPIAALLTPHAVAASDDHARGSASDAQPEPGSQPRGCSGTLLAVNAVIDADAVTPAAVAAAGRAAVEAGFATLKLKVGVEGLAVDLARVSALREACPGARIRLDANGAWAEPVARLALERLAALDIELIEQPLAPRELAALVRLRERSSIPLAADEALAEPGMAERLLEAGAVDVLVLKPSVLGGVRAAARLADRASAAGVRAFVTTTVDSSLGTALALQLAAALDERSARPVRVPLLEEGGERAARPAEQPRSDERSARPIGQPRLEGDGGGGAGEGLAHGLATGLALESDLVAAPLLPERGRMALPAAPGLGVEPDEAAIERCATGPWSARVALGPLPALNAFGDAASDAVGAPAGG